ncbi:hypothetical protein KP79_PYT20100 [Mizuhopecten yessoensis]|uniref:DUF4524 domain-containing protein n=1 Tax=Mizuhopecten yessoensis TaxID=6573 RepID=A0A210QU08_MIZYE|nr:hypothetical protein KP79_PYT20100 [Mizuhopecten yessoensis]
MPVVPVLMVLYTNDAVEVRYSDGSCLKMAPCGSTFVHHQSPGETIHPAHGMKVINQRCQFVTSDYRQKVLEALDFRNRFAERPYVCPDLLLQDQLVCLYANIRDVAWPQTLEKASYEYLPDGSVRLMSEDEHSSMVLSTHKQDFTVCYLSKVSRDKPKVKARHKFKARSMTATNNRMSTERASRQERFKSRDEEHKISPGNGNLSNNHYSSRNIMNVERTGTNINSEPRNISDELVQNENTVSDHTARSEVAGHSSEQKTTETDSITAKHNHDRDNCESEGSKEGHKKLTRETDSVEGDSGSPLSDDLQRRLTGDLSISPISLVSGLRSEKSSPCTEEEYRRYSTPTHFQSDTQGAETRQCVPGKGAAIRQYKREQQPDDGSFLDYPPVKNKNEDVDSALDETLTSHNVSQDPQRNQIHAGSSPTSIPNVMQKPSPIESRSKPLIRGEIRQKPSFEQEMYIRGKKSNESSPSSQSERRAEGSWEEPYLRNQSGEREVGSWEEYSPGSQSGDREAGSWEESPEARIHYTWVTRHYSCEECPVVWSHCVNLARAVLDNRESLEQKALKLCSNPKKKLSDHQVVRRNKCVLSTLPRPLPLSCEGQHLHSLGGRYLYDDEKDLEENLAVFKQGKLKVLLIEGVVFRLVRLATTKVVEIFPGDSSVITSQGLSGHFYKHTIPHGHDKVEERTYSLKSAPPTPPKAAYSIQKLIKRAHRFLLQAGQEDQMITNADVCCWKYVEKKLELVPTTVLEDCCVPGHGKFSAYSNGHVRILFDDRTSLEMTCDFSRRVKNCLEHTEGTIDDTRTETDENQSILVTKQHLTARQTGLCKLLLPNGQYQIVEVNHPGVFKKYTDAATEWEAWVNSSPGQRKDFYERWDKQDSHQVNCSDIVDNTVSNQASLPSHDVAVMTSKPSTSHQGVGLVQYSNRTQFSNSSIPHSRYVNRSDNVTNKWLSDEGSQGQGHYSQDQHGYGAYKKGYNISESSVGHLSSEGHSGNFLRSQSHLGYSIPPEKVMTSAIPGSYQGSGGQIGNISHTASRTSMDTLQGFNAVREALLKTSKAIQDIDCILDKKS